MILVGKKDSSTMAGMKVWSKGVMWREGRVDLLLGAIGESDCPPVEADVFGKGVCALTCVRDLRPRA